MGHHTVLEMHPEWKNRTGSEEIELYVLSNRVFVKPVNSAPTRLKESLLAPRMFCRTMNLTISSSEALLAGFTMAATKGSSGF